MKKRILFKGISLCTAVVMLMLSASLLIGRIFAMPLDEPLLFYNDNTWSREDRCPLKIIDGEYYVPLVLFAQLEGTKVRVNNSLNSFVISHGDYYVSFDATTGIAINEEGDYLYALTYTLDYGERYVPAVFACQNLDYGYELFTNKYSGKTAFRITDGSEELSLEELLSKYNPKILSTERPKDSTSETSIKDSTSVTTKTEHQDPQKILGNRIIYLTVDAGITNYTGAVLDTLSAYGYKATFFIDKDDITDYPLTLARIISEGHKLGIRPNTADVGAYTDIESFINELDLTNELLYRVYKIKTRTVRPDALAYNNAQLVSELYSEALPENGYVMWNASAGRVDGIKDNASAIDELIENIWNNNSLVMDFGSNYATSGVLSSVLSFISANADKCDVRLADSPYIPPTR